MLYLLMWSILNITFQVYLVTSINITNKGLFIMVCKLKLDGNHMCRNVYQFTKQNHKFAYWLFESMEHIQVCRVVFSSWVAYRNFWLQLIDICKQDQFTFKTSGTIKSPSSLNYSLIYIANVIFRWAHELQITTLMRVLVVSVNHWKTRGLNE